MDHARWNDDCSGYHGKANGPRSELHHHHRLLLLAEISLEVAGVELVALPGVVLLVEFALVEDIHEFL